MNGNDASRPERHHRRKGTYPLYFSKRQKPRRWPLVLRFAKGAVHQDIALPVVLHAIFACLVCYLEELKSFSFQLPSSMIPSLSIVLGLMLVFRNSTSYDRFWQGQSELTTICASIRNLNRSFLACSSVSGGPPPLDTERAETERAVRILVAYAYATKKHLRQEWNHEASARPQNGVSPFARILSIKPASVELRDENFDDLLPSGMQDYQEYGLGLPQQLAIQIEIFIKRGHDRGWFHAPQASQLTVQLNTAIAAFGKMEAIRLTPIPVAYLIHIRQVLALFGCVLPFAMAAELGWWTVLVVSLVTFTLYGIEAIAGQVEDPFGYDKNDIKMDALIEDLRVETMVMLDQWRSGGSMFQLYGASRGS